jgi:hypothetical protein
LLRFNIEKSTQLSNTEREELLSQIDFSRVNEETIATCKTNKLIPQQLITDAALALCIKLRKQLEETQNRLHSLENGSNKTRTNHTSSSSYNLILFFIVTIYFSLEYRSRYFDSSFRLPSRTRSTVTNSYDSPRSSSIYNHSKYDPEGDVDYLLPSRYLLSSSSGRYGYYSTYRH